jgi:hypothetical protein
MNRISPARPMTTKQPHLKAGIEVLQVILFLWLAWLLAGCGSQPESPAVAIATVLRPTYVQSRTRQTPHDAEPTHRGQI